jgi:hypothetical protein
MGCQTAAVLCILAALFEAISSSTLDIGRLSSSMLLFLPTLDWACASTTSTPSRGVLRIGPWHKVALSGLARHLWDDVHGSTLRLEGPMRRGRQRWPPCQPPSLAPSHVLASMHAWLWGRRRDGQTRAGVIRPATQTRQVVGLSDSHEGAGPLSMSTTSRPS